MIAIPVTLALLILLFLLSLMGRRGHEDLPKLRGWAYAHRGLHGKGRPENSMSAFQAALDGGYGIELDVHLMQDGNLAVIHDASLKRTAGADVKIEDLTLEDLDNYCLEGTGEKIPTLQQVLELFAGKAPIILELKSERGNYAALCQTVCAAMEDYKGYFCMESFDPRCVGWLRKNRPDILRGQLSANFLKDKESALPWHLKFAMTYLLPNFLTMPDFVAYEFANRKSLGVTLCRRLWGVQGVTWTVTAQQDFDTAVQEGYLPIFEKFIP